MVPMHLIQELAGADPEALAKIEISPRGWRCTGRLWMPMCMCRLNAGRVRDEALDGCAVGAAGGRAKTAAKAAAARQNGAKGGRPASRPRCRHAPRKQGRGLARKTKMPLVQGSRECGSWSEHFPNAI